MHRSLLSPPPLPPTAEEVAESGRRIKESLARDKAMTPEERDAYERAQFEEWLNRKRDGQ
jgi:hypothetical protein